MTPSLANLLLVMAVAFTAPLALGWCEMASHGYVVIDIDADRIRSEWWHVDTVLERTSGVSLAAAFETPRGARQLRRLS